MIEKEKNVDDDFLCAVREIEESIINGMGGKKKRSSSGYTESEQEK